MALAARSYFIYFLQHAQYFPTQRQKQPTHEDMRVRRRVGEGGRAVYNKFIYVINFMNKQ